MSSTASSTASEVSSNGESDYYIYKIYDERGRFYCPVSKETYASRVLKAQKKLSFYNEYFSKSKDVKICLVKSLGKWVNLAKAKHYRDMFVLAHQKEICDMKAKSTDEANSAPKKIKDKYNPLKDLQTAIKNLEITKRDISDLIEHNETNKKARIDSPVYDRNLISAEEMEVYREKFSKLDPTKVPRKSDTYYCYECVMFIGLTHKLRHLDTQSHKNNCKECKPERAIWVD